MRAVDVAEMAIPGTFWGGFIACVAGVVGVPLTALVTVAIWWMVRRVIHRPAVPAGRAPTNAGWGDRF